MPKPLNEAIEAWRSQADDHFSTICFETAELAEVRVHLTQGVLLKQILNSIMPRHLEEAVALWRTALQVSLSTDLDLDL